MAGATNKIQQQKEKDFDIIIPKDGFCDMSEDHQKIVVETCKEAYKKQHDGEFKYYKQMAIYIKESLDKHKDMKPSWHVIVGKLQNGTNLRAQVNQSSLQQRLTLGSLFLQELILVVSLRMRQSTSTYSGQNTQASSSSSMHEGERGAVTS